MKFLAISLFATAALAAPGSQIISNGSTFSAPRGSQIISGGSTFLARRGNTIGSGDSGARLTDESTNVSVSSIGDSFFSGQGNKADIVTNNISEISKNFALRRRLINGVGAIGGNGNGNMDSSSGKNFVAGGNQQIVGENITNSPVSTIGGTSSSSGSTTNNS